MDRHNKSSSGGTGFSREQDFRSYKSPSRDERRTFVRRRDNMQYTTSRHHHQSRRSQTNSDAYSVPGETRRLEETKEKEGEKNQQFHTSQSQPPLIIPAIQDTPAPNVSTFQNDGSQISVANVEAIIPKIPTDIRKARSSVRRFLQATTSTPANPQQRPSEQQRLQQAATSKNSSSTQQQQKPSEQQPSSSTSNTNSSTMPAEKPSVPVQIPNEYPDVIPVKQLDTKFVKKAAPPSDRLPIRSFAEIKRMSEEFGKLLQPRGKSENKCFKNFKYPHSPPPWKPKDLLPEPPNDDGYDSYDNIPLPSGEGPCGITSTQQNIALDIHCINTALKSLDPNERLKSLKLFIDEKTDCTIFFYLHAKEFAHGNESMLARVALQRFVMVLNNALQLYEISTIPEKLFGKNKSNSGKEWYIPLKNEYGYDAPEYVEFDRAGTSKKMAEIYTEFTKAETNILLDAHMLIQHSKELILEIQEKYINDHAGHIFNWLEIIKARVTKRQHVHHNFILWCHLSLPFKNAKHVLSLMEIMFYAQMKSISESLQKEFGEEKCSPLQHKRYYQAALKGFNCKDFGIERFHCEDFNFWYTTVVGAFFNDLCDIKDGNLKLCKPYIEKIRHSLDTTHNILQQKYGNFQNLFSDNKFWDKIIEGKCQKIPRPFDIYKRLAAFVCDVSIQNPGAFDYTTNLIRPYNKDLKKHIKCLEHSNNSGRMSEKEREKFVQNVIDDLMAHFYPILRTFGDLSPAHTAAIRLFTIFVLKGFLMEWEEYNKWTTEMRERKKFDGECNGLDLKQIKEYFGKDFMNLPANIMTAVWERKFHDRFFSSNVPKEVRELLTCSEFKVLPAATITNVLDFYEKIDASEIEVKFFKNYVAESDEELMDIDELDDSVLEDNNDSTNMASMMEVEGSNNDNDPSIQKDHISKFGLKPPNEFGTGRLSQWAFNNTVADCLEKGDGFLMAPINQPKEKTSNKPAEKDLSLNDFIHKIKFCHPVLKAIEEKLQRDFLLLSPAMQKWAYHLASVLENIISDKDENENDATNQESTTTSTEPLSNGTNANKKVIQKKLLMNVPLVAADNSLLKMLSPYQLIAVCSEKVSVMYPFPPQLLKSPNSQNIIERHTLKSCKIWDYLQGKKIKFNKEIVAFLCDMWKQTVKYSEKRKRDHKPAYKTCRRLQKGKSVSSDVFVSNVIGIRFPYDLREEKNLKHFCTIYINTSDLNFKNFKFHFDIKISPKNLIDIPYEIEEEETG